MKSTLKIKLLGQSALLTDEGELFCASKKALWMAGYVLLKKVMVPRREQAMMFWGSADMGHSLGSLRVALTKLPVAGLACLDVQRDRIGVAHRVHDAHNVPYTLDVDSFLADCNATELAHLQRAVAQYSGEFFDWLFAERNRLRQLAHSANLALAKLWRQQGNNDAARAVIDGWLRKDSADEAVHRLLMIWLAEDVGSDLALAQYDVYRRALAVNEGAAPSAAMAALAAGLCRRDVSAREMPSRIVPATLFLGRDGELAALHELLADPACRLLTLHGMGGVGAAEACEPATKALDMALYDGHMLPALDARIVLAQAATALCDNDKAIEHLLIVLESASQHQFTNVLADAILCTARLAVATRPALHAVAIEWAREIAESNEVSTSIRRFAADFFQTHPGAAPTLATGEARGLAGLAEDASKVLRDMGSVL